MKRDNAVKDERSVLSSFHSISFITFSPYGLVLCSLSLIKLKHEWNE